jgi:hypothetical protein
MPSAHTAREYRILRWIRKKPLPHRVVGETLAGEEISVAVNAESRGALSDAVESLSECVELVAKDKDGNLVRRLALGAEDLEPVEEETGTVGSFVGTDIPKLVDSIAKNMREVAVESANMQAGAFKEGFASMTEVVKLCLELLGRVDRRLQEAEARAGDSPTDHNSQLAMLALQRAFGGLGLPAPTGAPHGAIPQPGSNGGAVGFQITPEMIQALVKGLSGMGGEGDDHGSG